MLPSCHDSPVHISSLDLSTEFQRHGPHSMHHKICSGYIQINLPKTGLLLLPQQSSTYIDQLFLPTYSKWGSHSFQGLLGSSAGKESACDAGDPGSIPGLGRSAGEGIGYPLQYSWASLVDQLVKNPPPLRETWVNPWVGKIPWRRERLPTLVFWPGEFHGLYCPWGCRELDTTERFSLSFLMPESWTHPDSTLLSHTTSKPSAHTFGSTFNMYPESDPWPQLLLPSILVQATLLSCLHSYQSILGTSLAVQCLRFRIPNAGGWGLIPGQGTRSHMLQLKRRSHMPQLKNPHVTVKIEEPLCQN